MTGFHGGWESDPKNWEAFEEGPVEVEPDQGMYPKYVVFKYPHWDAEVIEARASTGYDGTVEWLELVDDFFFVLKPISDKHARVALAAYAESVKDEKPQLAADIMEVLSDG